MIHVHGWDISQQMVMTGAVVGLSYSAIAAGLILVYRANGIINFAVVAFGAVALGVFGVLTEHGWGLWPCLLVAVPFAALAGDAPRGRRHPPPRRRPAPRAADGDDRHRAAPRLRGARVRGTAARRPARRRLPHVRPQGLELAGHEGSAHRRPRDQRADRGADPRGPARAVHDPHASRSHGARRGVELREVALDGYSRGAHVDAGVGHRRRVHRGHDHRARRGAVRHPARCRERDRATHARLPRAGQGAAHRDDRPHAHPLAHDPGRDRARDHRGDLPAERAGDRRQRLRALAVRGDARRRADAPSFDAGQHRDRAARGSCPDASSRSPNGSAASG